MQRFTKPVVRPVITLFWRYSPKSCEAQPVVWKLALRQLCLLYSCIMLPMKAWKEFLLESTSSNQFQLIFWDYPQFHGKLFKLPRACSRLHLLLSCIIGDLILYSHFGYIFDVNALRHHQTCLLFLFVSVYESILLKFLKMELHKWFTSRVLEHLCKEELTIALQWHWICNGASTYCGKFPGLTGQRKHFPITVILPYGTLFALIYISLFTSIVNIV